MEVQLTEYENAAYAIFIVLLTRTILSMDINLYMPLSKVDENMNTAHKKDAVKTEKFFFRKHILEGLFNSSFLFFFFFLFFFKIFFMLLTTMYFFIAEYEVEGTDPSACVPMTLDTIFNGKVNLVLCLLVQNESTTHATNNRLTNFLVLFPWFAPILTRCQWILRPVAPWDATLT
jgi:hypothetical protein